MPTPKEAVELLEATVLTNNVQEVQALFDTYHEFEFTARALGLAMRFCGVDMVATLIQNGATLSFLPTRNLLNLYLRGLPNRWAGRSYDFAKYMFPGISIPDEVEGHEPISAAQRQKVIEYLVSKNMPELPSFLYYSILGADTEVYDYLRAHNFTRLPSPYMEIVEGLLSWDEARKIRGNCIWYELRVLMDDLEDAEVPVLLERLMSCVPQHSVSVIRYRVLSPKRACKGALFPFLAEHTDLAHKCNRWKLIGELVANNNVVGLEYVVAKKWVWTTNELEHLFELVREAPNASAEMTAYVVQVLEDHNTRENEGDASSAKNAINELSLDAEPKPLALRDAQRDWGIRKIGDGEYEIFSYKGSDKHVVVPEAVGRGIVTSVASGAFAPDKPGIRNDVCIARDGIESVEFPGTIQTFGDHLFSHWINYNLRQITFQDGPQKISDSALFRCIRLREAFLPTTLRSIGDHAFESCLDLEQIQLPPSLEKIGVSAFAHSGLQQISFPPNLRSIPTSAFQGCNALTSATFNEGLKVIEHSAFEDCSALSTAMFNEGLEVIEHSAFEDAGLQDVSLPSTLNTVEEHAFFHCPSMHTVRFAEGSDTHPLRIGESAFERNSALSTVVFASGLESIGKRAFAECPIESLVIPEGTKTIEEEAFCGCNKLHSQQIPADTKLGFRAFSGCDALANPNGGIVVNQTLFGVADYASIEGRLTPLELGPEVSEISTYMTSLPQIVYRRPEEASATLHRLQKPKIGAHYCFGRFPIETNFKLQPLPWLILTVQDDRVLLVTARAIMARLYPEQADAKWATSAARTLLNGAFMNVAFTPEERKLIVPTDTTRYRSPETTTDDVFLLNASEIRKYFQSHTDLRAKATPYALAQREGETRGWQEYVPWSLRVQAQSLPFIDNRGSLRDARGDASKCQFLRPAIWIRLPEKERSKSYESSGARARQMQLFDID